MKRPPSRFKRGVRGVQLVLSVGAATLIFYAMLSVYLVVHVPMPVIESHTTQVIVGALVGRGLLIFIAPPLCFVTALVIDGLNPWRLGFGTLLFVELALELLRWVVGGFEDGNASVTELALNVGVCAAVALVAVWATKLAAQRAARMAPAATASTAAVAPSGAAPVEPAVDFAEQMRQAQEKARAELDAPAAEAPAPAAAVDEKA